MGVIKLGHLEIVVHTMRYLKGLHNIVIVGR